MIVRYTSDMRHLLPMIASLLVASSLAACRTSTPPVTTATTSTESPEVAPWWFVWTRDEGGLVTHVVAAPDGEPTQVGELAGAWIGVQDGERARLFSFDREVIATKQSDCDCEMEALHAGEQADCLVDAELEVGVLRSMGATGEAEVATHVPPLDTIDGESREVFATLDGTIGPYVFTTACIERYACGAAHGDRLCAQRIYDLRTGQEFDAWDMAAEPLRGPDMLRFVREVYEDEHEAAELAEEDIVLSRVAPLYEESFIPRIEEQYTGPACYACSDGLWDSYTISSRRTVESLPTLAAAWLKSTPAPPQAFTPPLDHTIGGWSSVPPDPRFRELVESMLVGSK